MNGQGSGLSSVVLVLLTCCTGEEKEERMTALCRLFFPLDYDHFCVTVLKVGGKPLNEFHNICKWR